MESTSERFPCRRCWRDDNEVHLAGVKRLGEDSHGETSPIGSKQTENHEKKSTFKLQ